MVAVAQVVDERLSFAQSSCKHIEDTLLRRHGRVEGPFGAARLLDLNPHTLRSKMCKLGIDARCYRSITWRS